VARLTVSVSQVFDSVSALIKKQYPRAVELTMPYCSLVEEPISKRTYYRVEFHFRQKTGDWIEATAIAKVDPETGRVEMFQKGYTWQNWV
jgi:hypothetical protein